MIGAAFANAGILPLVSMFIGVVPLAMGIVFAIWPNEQRLGVMRPLSLATAFAAVSGSTLGFLNVFRSLGLAPTAAFSSVTAIGLAESLVPVFFGFGCLTGAWLCVAIGLWRRP